MATTVSLPWDTTGPGERGRARTLGFPAALSPPGVGGREEGQGGAFTRSLTGAGGPALWLAEKTGLGPPTQSLTAGQGVDPLWSLALPAPWPWSRVALLFWPGSP